MPLFFPFLRPTLTHTRSETHIIAHKNTHTRTHIPHSHIQSVACPSKEVRLLERLFQPVNSGWAPTSLTFKHTNKQSETRAERSRKTVCDVCGLTVTGDFTQLACTQTHTHASSMKPRASHFCLRSFVF